jgi:diguanylate cyclase (GGDEF)-like protein
MSQASQPSPALPEQARILVVDDDLHTRALLKELCESQGHLVDQAADGHVALERIQQFKPDLVLLDVMMPGMDGFEVLGKVRAKPELARLPVIILTAAGDIDGKIRGIELGADDYITKPFRLFELTTRLRSALAVRRYQERLQAAEQELENLRAGDLLTGTGSYAQLRAGLDYEVSRARRYGRPLSTLLMAVDNFDEVRAQLGRSQMDKAAQELVERLRQGLRETDRLFRIDRDEFVALLPETDPAGARAAAERVLAQVAHHPQGLRLLTGTASFPGEAVQTPEDVMRTAQRDLEAQRAKQGK